MSRNCNYCKQQIGHPRPLCVRLTSSSSLWPINVYCKHLALFPLQYETEIKWTLISQLWNLSGGFSIGQKDGNVERFWYLRHLRSPGQFENLREIASQNVWWVLGSSQRCSSGTGGVSGVPKGGFYCLWVFWGVFWGVSVLSEVYGSAFYSNLIYINGALTFSKRRGCPRCLKYQNVPTFQSWDTRVYFISVSDDHTIP